jgi:hypothetical protein
MSLFVHPENQKIIWNIINGNPYIIRYFESKPQQEKEEWFRKSIEDFYTRIQGKEIDPNQLNILNKEVLTSMIQSVHLQNPQYTAHNSTPPVNIPPTQQPIQQPTQQPIQQPIQQPTHDPMNMMTYANTINTPTIVKDSKEDIFNKQFQMRQQEYDTMLQRKTPQEINFRETSNDENKDINELLERERRDREELMKPIQQTNKLNIDSSNSDNIKLETVELQEPKEKKSVSWNTESPKSNLDELVEVQKSEMYSMRLHIIDMTKQLEETNKRLSRVETLLQKEETNNDSEKNQEKPQHHVSKYANLEENPTNTSIKDETVFVEDVDSDSDA